MHNKKCTRRDLFIKEIKHDWDELNVSFKSLIIVGALLFLMIILIVIFSSQGIKVNNSIELIFRTTLASVFGFLLSSNIKFNKKEISIKLEDIKKELSKIEENIDTLEENIEEKYDTCELETYYKYKDINLVQISIALIICIICISVLGFLSIINSLENAQEITQIRDLMCSSVGFLIGESKKK